MGGDWKKRTLRRNPPERKFCNFREWPKLMTAQVMKMITTRQRHTGMFWDDLFSVKGKERTGISQHLKPLPLLRRIIKDILQIQTMCGIPVRPLLWLCHCMCSSPRFGNDVNGLELIFRKKQVELVLKQVLKMSYKYYLPKIIHRRRHSNSNLMVIVRSKNIHGAYAIDW